MASLPPCLPQFAVPHCQAQLCCGDSGSDLLLVPKPGHFPLSCWHHTCLRHPATNKRLWVGAGMGTMGRGDTESLTAGMTSCSMCSARVTAATSPCPLCVERAGGCSQQSGVSPPAQSDAQGELSSGATQCEQMAAPASPVTAGPFPRDAPV